MWRHLVEIHRELQLGFVEEIIDILVSVSPVIIGIGKRLLPLSSPPSYFSMDICKPFVYKFDLSIIFVLFFVWFCSFLLCISPLESNIYELEFELELEDNTSSSF